MSYILDALKKSGKKHKRDSVPDLHTFQDVIIYGQAKRTVWPYIILAALMLNAGILFWWLAPWEAEKTGEIAKPADQGYIAAKPSGTVLDKKDLKSNDIAAPAGIPGKAKSTLPAAKEELPASSPEVLASAPASEPLKPPKKVAEEDPEAGRKKEQTAVPKPGPDSAEIHDKPMYAAPSNSPLPGYIPPKEPQPSTNAIIASKQKVFSFDELPLSVQQGLPDIFISAHLYSRDPSSRMVRINGRMLKEGQDLNEGIKLEQITTEGVILSYMDYRFSVKLY